MKFNLQWLSFPIFGYSLCLLIAALVCIPDVFYGESIIPLIAFGIILIRLTHAFVSGIIGGLVYLAFRNTNLTLKQEN